MGVLQPGGGSQWTLSALKIEVPIRGAACLPKAISGEQDKVLRPPPGTDDVGNLSCTKSPETEGNTGEKDRREGIRDRGYRLPPRSHHGGCARWATPKRLTENRAHQPDPGREPHQVLGGWPSVSHPTEFPSSPRRLIAIFTGPSTRGEINWIMTHLLAVPSSWITHAVLEITTYKEK